MELGHALESKPTDVKVEYSPYDKGQLVSCWKCPECGHSETIDLKKLK